MIAINTPGTTEAAFPRQYLDLTTSILYAEDDASLRDVVSRVLSSTGYRVDTAPNGQDAWTALHSKTYNLLITDNQMPCLTGAELIRRVRLAGMTVPIILVSGTLGALSLDELPWIECGTTLAKPFTHEELISAVREVLRAAVSAPTPTGVRLPALEKFSARIQSYRGWGINE